MEHMGLTGKAQDARLRIQLEVGEVMVGGGSRGFYRDEIKLQKITKKRKEMHFWPL